MVIKEASTADISILLDILRKSFVGVAVSRSEEVYFFDGINEINYQLSLDKFAAISVWLTTLPSFA